MEQYNKITLSVTDPDSIVFGTAPPKSAITNLIDGQTVAAGSVFKVTGTALDINPDGFVGGIELSHRWRLDLDTLRRARTSGRSTGRCPTQVGVYKLQYRAGDNDFNLEAARTVLVNVVEPSAVVDEAPHGACFQRDQCRKLASASAPGRAVTITGAAIDQDGGRSAASSIRPTVAISWTTATGTSAWSFVYQAPTTGGLKTLLYRAGDNDLNLESANTLILNVVDPSTLPSGAPQSTVQNLVNGQKLAPGAALKVLGSAHDQDGTVSRVEVSVDEGYTWKPATGVDQWSFDWAAPADEGVYKFQYRAVDNDLHLEPVHTVLVQVQDLFFALNSARPRVLAIHRRNAQPGLRRPAYPDADAANDPSRGYEALRQRVGPRSRTRRAGNRDLSSDFHPITEYRF